MKRVFILIWGLFICVVAIWPQLTHIVQRGETYELIAKRYNISADELKTANPDEDECFVGMTLNLPKNSNNSRQLNYSTPTDLRLMDEAFGYIKVGKYKKATSTYSDILEKSPTAQAYFGRAISYYNREKYKSAMEDFRSAMHSPDCTEDMKDKCEELISDAEKLREKQHKKRNAFWGGVAAVAVTATAAYVASEQNKAQQRNMYMPPSNINGYQRDTRNDYLLDPRLAVMQVQQQEWEEYQTFLRLSGSNISFEQYQLYKNSTPQDSAIGEVNGLGNNNSHIGSSSNKIGTGKRPCKACNGKGSFTRDDGSVATYGHNTKKKCPICGFEYWSSTFHRHENCKYCHGTGYVDN